jgi:hypothetical protein
MGKQPVRAYRLNETLKERHTPSAVLVFVEASKYFT